MRTLRLLVVLIIAAFIAPSIAALNAETSQEKKETAKNVQKADRTLEDAAQVLEEAVSAPDKGIPKDLLERAECVGVFPGLAKGAFIVGGEFGTGVFTCRKDDQTMGPPAFFTMGGPSIGWQFGGEEADVVLLVMNPRGMNHLLKSKFTLGGEASAAAGPVGRTAQAATDLQMHAEILSWSRSRGIFAGASIKGTVVQQSQELNNAFYGKALSAEDLLIKHKGSEPKEARSFIETVNEQTRREGGES